MMHAHCRNHTIAVGATNLVPPDAGTIALELGEESHVDSLSTVGRWELVPRAKFQSLETFGLISQGFYPGTDPYLLFAVGYPFRPIQEPHF